ncbi:MAG: 4-hydroxybenzoate polyprenyltransferase [Bacillariaceae sp.]|jgi:4-hydroxybenzoate polyprenyltransferase
MDLLAHRVISPTITTASSRTRSRIIGVNNFHVAAIASSSPNIINAVTKLLYYGCGNKIIDEEEKNEHHYDQQQQQQRRRRQRERRIQLHHQNYPRHNSCPYTCRKHHHYQQLSSSSFVGGEFRRAYSSSSSKNNSSNINKEKNDSITTLSAVGTDKDTGITTSGTTTATATTTSDPSMVNWVDDYLPSSLRPYAHLSRMDKPIGTWLLLWPCYWSTAMAAGVNNVPHIIDADAVNSTTASTNNLSLFDILPDPKLLGLFTIGAFVMRGAGCTINDLWDRDLDRQVERTKSRPLASGTVTQTQAISWLAIQLSVGLSVLLSLPHTQYCFIWGAASLPIIVAYPLMKRIFDYPQLVLGLCFNWGAIMGWAAVHGSIDYNVILPLYLSGVTWTIGYDTLYAHQDKKDDTKLGLKSTAITFGRTSTNDNDHNVINNNDDDDDSIHKRPLHKLALTTFAFWLLAGYNGVAATSAATSPATTMMMSDLLLSPSFGIYAMGVTGAYSHLIWQIHTADLNDPHNLAERFRSNAKVGGIIFGSILASKIALVVV